MVVWFQYTHELNPGGVPVIGQSYTQCCQEDDLLERMEAKKVERRRVHGLHVTILLPLCAADDVVVIRAPVNVHFPLSVVIVVIQDPRPTALDLLIVALHHHLPPVIRLKDTIMLQCPFHLIGTLAKDPNPKAARVNRSIAHTIPWSPNEGSGFVAALGAVYGRFDYHLTMTACKHDTRIFMN